MNPVSKELIISGECLVGDVQKSFNSYYPFLKIEFSTNPKGIFAIRKHRVSAESSIGKITYLPAAIKLNVAEYRTVAEVEKDCAELLGLSLQVLRKSGNVWNVISLTDSWTLESQNKAGECISTEMAAAS